MNMYTFDEINFRSHIGFSHEAYNEYSGIYNRLKESINVQTKVPVRHLSKKLDRQGSFIMLAPRKKLSCVDGLLFQNKSFREEIIEPQRVNRLKEIHKENLLLSSRSRRAVAVQRKISSMSQKHYKKNPSIRTDPDEDLRHNQSGYGEEFLLPRNSIFNDLDEITERSKIQESQFRTLKKKTKRIYDSLSDEEAPDEEIYEAYYVEPFSKLRLSYDLLLFILVFYSMFNVPYQLAFYINQPKLPESGFLVNLLIDIMFIFDIVLSFFTAYYDFEEKLVKFYYLMALHYIQTWFLIDFLSGIPINSILNIIVMKCPHCIYTEAIHTLYQSNSNVNYNLFKMLRLLKAFKVFSTNSFIDKIISSVKQTVHVAKTIRLITTLLIFSMLIHLFACLFIFFGFHTYPNWIVSLKLEPKDSFTIYIASLHFICTTVLSIGYGDILTYNITERLINGFLLVVGLLLYSWALSSLTAYLITDDQIVVEYRSKCIILEDIKLCYNDMSDELYSKIQRHLLYKLNSQKMDVNAVFNSLPIGLRNNLIIEMYKPIIDNFVFFKNYTSTDFIIQVILSFKPLLSLKGEKLLNDGDVLDEIIFVKKGKLILEFPLPIVVDNNNNTNNKFSQDNHVPSFTKSASYIGGSAQALGGLTLYESCGGRLTYAFQTMVSLKGALPLLKKTETRHYVLSDFDFHKIMDLPKKKDSSKKKEQTNLKIENKNQQYVKLIEIRQNEHFGDVLMFLTKRSPLRIRVRTKKAELFLLKKTDAVEISNAFPKIWKQIIKKSLVNMKQINRLINKTLKFFFIHYEGTKNFLGRSLISSYNNQTLGGSIIQENPMMSKKNKAALFKKLTPNKSASKTKITNKLLEEFDDIDTSNSELESIPDNYNLNSKIQSESSSSDDETDVQQKQKKKINKLLETFEEETLQQNMQKFIKQSIIYKNYEELFELKDEIKEKNNIVSGWKKAHSKGINKYNLFDKQMNPSNLYPKSKTNYLKTRKSSSSSSGSSIVPENNNNEDNETKNKSSISSSSSSDNNNKPFRSKTGMHKVAKTSLYKNGINGTPIVKSCKSSKFTYTELQNKQPSASIPDELVEKKVNQISYITPLNNNSSCALNNYESSDSRENVYSEFHSNEGELKDNLFVERPPLDSYDPFTNYEKCNFGINENFTEENNTYNFGNLINSFNNVCFLKQPTIGVYSKEALNIEVFNPANNNTFINKSNFDGTLRNNDIVKSEILSNNKPTIKPVTLGPNAPKCTFTFSRFNDKNNNNGNKNGLISKDDDFFEDSSSNSGSSVDTQKRSLVKINKPSVSITPLKGNFFQRNSTKFRISKKKTFSYEASSNFDRAKTLGLGGRDLQNNQFYSNIKQEMFPFNSNVSGTICDQKKSTRDLINRKNKYSNMSIISHKHQDDDKIDFKKKSSILLLNLSRSSDGNEKGKEDLEVEKIMGIGMTPSLSPNKQKCMFRNMLNSTLSNGHVTNPQVNESYKKKLFGLSPKFKKKNSIAKGGAPSNALERIASNIQENSTNLNEPREFYSNLFTQFLDSKNVNDNDNETEMKKLATFDRPLNIKEETEESEELEHTLVKNQSKVNDFTHSVINHYTLPEHHEKKNYKNLRRNKTIVI